MPPSLLRAIVRDMQPLPLERVLLATSAAGDGGSRAYSDALERIAAALSPVVLVSAAALLAVGISQKHVALGDRIRTLSAELRAPGVTPARRQSVAAQLELFTIRIRHSGRAHSAVYLAICCFLAMILVITLQQRFTGLWGAISLVLFVGGVSLMLAGIVLELLELRLADRTIARELDHTASSGQAARPDTD
jgi:hypothetical protein